MTAIEQLKTRMKWGRNLTEEDERLFNMLADLYNSAQNLYLDLQDAGQDVNPDTGKRWSIFSELGAALNAVDQGLVVSRTVVVEVVSTLTDEEIKAEFARAVGDMKHVDKPRITVKE